MARNHKFENQREEIEINFDRYLNKTPASSSSHTHLLEMLSIHHVLIQVIQQANCVLHKCATLFFVVLLCHCREHAAVIGSKKDERKEPVRGGLEM